jgi:hypothetical protein
MSNIIFKHIQHYRICDLCKEIDVAIKQYQNDYTLTSIHYSNLQAESKDDSHAFLVFQKRDIK